MIGGDQEVVDLLSFVSLRLELPLQPSFPITGEFETKLSLVIPTSYFANS